MKEISQKRQLAAIMFTDIVGYTALMGADEDRAFEVLKKNQEIHHAVIKNFNGTLIKEIGDGMLISFPLASDAVKCAIEIQKTCKKQDYQLKIGIHEGEMVFSGEDVYGDGVNIASRLQEIAGEGCIAISEKVYSDIKNKAGINTRYMGDKKLKNVDGPVKVYEVICEGHPLKEDTTENLKNIHGHRQPIMALRLKKIKTVILTVLVAAVVILVYPMIFKKDKFEEIRDPDGRISIAVMPFKNLSGDSLYNVWQGGFQNLIITTLSNSKELSVRQYQTMYSILAGTGDLTYASITPSKASELALKLDTRTFILGNILKAGNNIRVSAQLVNAETEEIYKTYEVSGNTEDDIFAMADSLSGLIKNYLEIKKLLEQYDSPEYRGSFYTNSSAAFQYYIHGFNAFRSLDYQAAIEWLSKSIETDPDFINAYVALSFTCMVSGNNKQAKNWCNKAYKKRHELPLKGKLMLDHLHAYYFETPDQQIKYLKQILEIEELNPTYWYFLGLAYQLKNQYEDAIIYFEEAIEIHKKWGTNYRNPWNYYFLGKSYHKVNRHKREKEVYESGLSIIPDFGNTIRGQAICALSHGDTNEAEIFITKYQSIRKNKSLWPESRILSDVGSIYSEANLFDEAEINYRHALKLYPGTPRVLNNMAWFLINNDINVNEGVELIQKALELEPDNWYYLDTKGWGLYKQGRYEEALKILKDAWELRPRYNHGGYQHIREVEKALDRQNK